VQAQAGAGVVHAQALREVLAQRFVQAHVAEGCLPRQLRLACSAATACRCGLTRNSTSGRASASERSHSSMWPSSVRSARRNLRRAGTL
jgi:hypothetical protein